MTKINQDSKGEDDKNTINNQKLFEEDVIKHKQKTFQDTDISAESISKLETSRLHPFVHWAQSQTHITLRVDLIQAENLNANIEDDGLSLTVSAQGTGAHGLRDYYFQVKFFSKVDEKFECHIIERYILILIRKANSPANWPRLTKDSAKLPWLRVDFDRFASESSDESEHDYNGGDNHSQTIRYLKEELERTKLDSSNQSSNSSSSSNSFNLLNLIRKNQKDKDLSRMKYDYRKEAVAEVSGKNTAKQAMDVKKTYLFIYNLMMFIMFLKVYLVLVIKNLNGTVDDDIVQGTAFIVKMLTYTQLLETIHPVLGLVPGGPLMPFTQVIGRLLVNYYLSEASIRIDSAPYAQYLFVVWSSIEIFRYSFYALRVFKVDVKALTWCRYTLFMPLYPMGGLCETMVVLSTIKYYEKNGSYGLSLPNAANISFSFPFMFKIYIVGLWATIYYLMSYMWSQRCKQLKEKIA